jgi:hypothetical protein
MFPDPVLIGRVGAEKFWASPASLLGHALPDLDGSMG